MRILIVEDEKELSYNITKYLNDDQLTCEVASNYIGAIEKIRSNEYSCIILDITIKEGKGVDLLKKLKAMNKAEAVLVVSSQKLSENTITESDKDANDYLTKPFHLPELGARVSAIIRRKSVDGESEIKAGELILDSKNKSLVFKDEPISLTRKEYELLLYLVDNSNRLVTKEAIVQHLWGGNKDMVANYDLLYSHIKNLRKKIMNAGCADYIKAIYGMGYKFMIPHTR